MLFFSMAYVISRNFATDYETFSGSRFKRLRRSIIALALDQVLLADGWYICDSSISNSVIGLRSSIGPDVTFRSSIIMGADFYETDEEKAENKRLGRPNIGVGEGSTIECALIDKNAHIGRNVHIRHLPERQDSEKENWVARDGLVIVPKSAVIPDNTII